MITSAGVAKNAAGTPEIVAASNKLVDELQPFSFAKYFFKWLYEVKYIAENGISRKKQARDPL